MQEKQSAPTAKPDWSDALSWLAANLSDSEFDRLKAATEAHFSLQRHGDLAGWLDALGNLPAVGNCFNDFSEGVRFGTPGELTDDELSQLRECLQVLIPWRKGPFQLYDIDLDTEWRSDLKWARIKQHVELESRDVLDIGCGNGYHLWRMLAHVPRRLLGIDPSPRFVVQFYMLKAFYRGQIPIDLLPLRSEDMPAAKLFDTVLSMGVLYHRKSPIHHLEEARNLLKPGGQLVLETLTIDGDATRVLLPSDRYAMMRNVWFIPSEDFLMRMLQRTGYNHIEKLDTSITSTDEQRRTEWMLFHSLQDFLDPADMSKTIEGYPRPQRTVIIAKA